MFCDTCLAIFSKKWGLADEEWSHSVGGPHHKDLIELRRSASENCRICKAIWLECIIAFGKEDWTNAEVSTSFKVAHQSASIEHAIKQGRRMELQIEVSRTLGRDEIHRRMFFDLLPYNLAENHCPKTTESTTSQDTLSRWYRDCLGNHKECRPIFDGSYLPSRLLDVGEPSSSEPAKLVTIDNGSTIDGKNLHNRTPVYATLSHCWGKSQPLRLLTQNMRQMKQGVPRESLPRIFSEAITVCWQLGIQYLWIDCLCICQDSEEDWVRESSLMGKIYSHAIINIAATGSVDCDGSLFDATSGRPSVGLISWGVLPESEYVVVENNIEWAKSFLNQPLLRRAWVMQERFLATRIIHFAGSELIWECRTTAATESYPIQVPDVLRPFHDRRNRFWRTDFVEDDGAWSVLVQDYSKCELTFSKDKLVALSGLISTLKSRGLARGRCWAGMWEADLPYGLLWTRAAMDENRWPRVRPGRYRAPSWSWASLDCPVWTEWASGTGESLLISFWEVREDSDAGSTRALSDYPLSIRIVGPLAKVSIISKGFGVEALGRGVERVQGISYCISRIFGQRTPEHHGENSAADLETTNFLDDTWNDAVFDDFDEKNLEKSIWCAPIYNCEKWTENTNASTRLLGLLLEKVEGNTFRRVGAFSVGHYPDQEALKRLSACTYTVI
ncbi:HET-domain-containing protein [Zopfia rhizophila CBS 207.26]|uniref:HET-domain-containing protein n=1 Tax=Zopfia rhizophila CBS 207.26 TaxID=1314779 RepID=A0A6A6E988_9PEZI|nr:HET-domain-containing protein [Zopfia rhizophila CBS 207.26]